MPLTFNKVSPLLVLAALVLACGPGKTDTDTNHTASLTHSTGDPPDSTSTTAPTTGDTTTTTGDASTGPASTGDPAACAPGPLDGDLECAPQGDTYAFFSVSFLNFADKFDEECEVGPSTDDGTAQEFDLTCPSSQVGISLHTEAPHVPLDLVMGAKVRLQYEYGMDGERPTATFALFDDQGVPLAAGVDTPFLPLTLGPLEFTLVSSSCDGTGGECAVIQRAGVQVSLAGATAVAFDRNTATLAATPTFELLVGSATRTTCTDPECGFNYSPSTTTALLVRAPG